MWNEKRTGTCSQTPTIHIHQRLEGNYIANHEARRVFGYSHDEILSMSIRRSRAGKSKIPGENRQKISAKQKQTVYEVDCTTKKVKAGLEVRSGTIYQGETRCDPGYRAPRPERKQTEEALRRARTVPRPFRER